MGESRIHKTTGRRHAARGKGSSTAGYWLLALFATPFAAFGVGMLLLSVIPTVYDWGRMQAWQPVQATLVSASLERSRSRNSSSYGVSARYRYEVAGQTYGGERVAVGSGMDNIGDFQEALGRRLEAAQRDGRPVTAWVNPANPQEAVLDRSLRPGLLMFKMLFVVIFGGAGLGMLYGAWRGRRSEREASTPQALAQPWTARRAWAGNSIRSNKRYEVWVAWVFAVVCNAVVWPVLAIHGARALARPDYALLAVFAAMLAAGVGVLVWALRATRDVLRFGDVRLVLDPFPGAIGGHVGGALALPVAFQPGMPFTVTLCCLRHYRSRSGKSDSPASAVWQAQGMAQLEPRDAGVRLSFRFDVPSGLPATEAADGEYHSWSVTVESADPELPFARTFDIPVYATGGTSAALRADAARHPALQQARSAALQAVSRMERTPGGVRLYQPCGRSWRSSLVCVLTGGGFVAVAHVAQGQAPGLLVAAFVAVGGALLLGGLYAVANSLTVELDGRGVRTERRLLGLMLIHHQAPARDIARLQMSESYTVTTGTKQETFFRIDVVLKNGKKLTVSDSLSGRAAADQLLASIAAQTGYRRG